MSETIFALATAPGRAAVAVVRISGPTTLQIIRRLTGSHPKPRLASVRRLRDDSGVTLDQALTVWFPGPASYTGEDCAELQLHGSTAIVDAVTAALLAAGARLALPGEFTRRAFENGKLDLGQAEAVADLVDAETQAQARQALGQLGGALGRRYNKWRDLLLNVLALLEAGVDFPDEEVPPEIALEARDLLARMIGEIDAGLDDQRRGQRVREGYQIAIVGAPNAGKSSLLNGLIGRSAAIVTDTPGATRDIIEAPIVLAGYKVILADMAGLRVTEDPVEAEGVRRARAWAETADLRLWVVDGAADDGWWREASGLVGRGDICLLNKSDLGRGADGIEAERFAASLGMVIWDLSLRGGGVDGVLEHLTQKVVSELQGSDFPTATRERHASHLRSARDHLARAGATLNEPELAAEDVRLAARELASVAGMLGAEDVLGRIFASFCIGK
jgi:tRNA modification GTPase